MANPRSPCKGITKAVDDAAIERAFAEKRAGFIARFGGRLAEALGEKATGADNKTDPSSKMDRHPDIGSVQ